MNSEKICLLEMCSYSFKSFSQNCVHNIEKDGYKVFVKICLSILESISKDDMTELTFNGWLVK